MSVRFLPVVVGTAGIVCALFLPSVQAQAAERPNIVLFMGDDHGWDETGYNGHPYLKTPVLDEMARTGLRLDRFYSAGSSCSPTRGSVITGRHPNRYGTFNPGWSIRPEEIGIAQILRRAGYACGHFGKWHLGPVKAESPTNPGAMGFETWISHDNFFELNPYLSRNGGPPEQFKGESSEIVVAEAIRFIDQMKQAGRPFFVVVWFGSPHEPYSGLEKDLALYDHLPASFANRQVRLTSNETGLPVQRLQREVLRERFAEITAMDRAIGQLRNHLDGQRLRQNTLVWYCGDNGTPPEANATVPFRGQKGNVYEGGVRVPGVIEWPARIPKPRASDVNAVTSDILPTLCKLATERKHLTDIIKMLAYQAESDLLAFLRPHYARIDQEGRTLLHELFQAAADIDVTPTELRITICPLSSPHRTLAVQALYETLTEAATVFPGSRLTTRFATHPRPQIGLAFPGPRPSLTASGASISPT